MDYLRHLSTNHNARDAAVALLLAVVLVSSVAAALLVAIAPPAVASDTEYRSAGDRTLRLGVVDLLARVTTLNPLLYTMTEEMMVIWPCYSTLLTYDQDADEIGDLARTWSISPDGMTIEIHLYQTAVWYDKNSPGPYQAVTARDVMFTYFAIQNDTSNNLHTYLPAVNGQPVIMMMYVGPTDWDLTIKLSSPYAPITGALHSIPILPKYIWEGKPLSWPNFGTSPVIAPCIGSGPFFYAGNGLPSTSNIQLVRSPTWFAMEERGWQLRVNRLVISSQTSPDHSLAAFKAGSIDLMMWPSTTQYLNDLALMEAAGDAVRLHASTGFVYEYNMNQMTDELRAELGQPFENGTSNQLLLDPVVKTAIAMSYDKQTFVDQVCGGLGRSADSLVPYVHPYYYDYGGPSAPAGEIEHSQDVAGARALLYNAGWQYKTLADGASHIEYGSADYYTYYPLCKIGGTSQLSFRFCTLSQSPEYDVGGRLLAGWADDVGIDLWYDYSLKSTGEMNSVWWYASYDLWLWDWVFTPESEVSTDVLYTMTTEAIGTWSDVYYSNPIYDDLYDQSLTTVNPAQRKIVTDEMQRIAYEDSGCQPMAYRDDLFAARSVAPDYWTNWGNWSEQWALDPSHCFPWLFTTIEPMGNSAPDIVPQSNLLEGQVGSPLTFGASGSDDYSNLEYRWIFGDGGKSDWSTSSSAVHAYSSDGYYQAAVVAREVGSSDGYMSHACVTVRMSGTNTAPHSLDFTIEPPHITAGTLIHLNGSATDDQNDSLVYSWDFGYGIAAYGQSVTHRFTLGDSSVTMYVDDGHLGVEPRPVALTRTLTVTENSPPSINVPDFPIVTPRQSTDFLCTCTEPDEGDELRLTWHWGDDSVNVTNLQSTGGSFATYEAHVYKLSGLYTLTVWIDDLTGIPGHNVSDSGLVQVYPIPNKAPVIDLFTVDDYTAFPGQELTFSLLASDSDNDMLIMTIDFGDGQTASTVQEQGLLWVSKHAYATEGYFEVWATVSDGASIPAQAIIPVFVEPVSFDVHLRAGWNLFSLPLLANYTASTLGLSFGSVVVPPWDPWTLSYGTGFIVGISPPYNDFPILEGKGYWIYVSAARTLVLYGAPLMTTHTYEWSVPAGGGWVMVGFPMINETVHASDIPGWCAPPNSVTMVARYNTLTHLYQAYIIQFPPTDFALIWSEGYWVFLKNSVTFTYGP